MMRDSSRYPYTHAYDWLREGGLIVSRSDGPAWTEAEAWNRGVTRERLCMILAEQYIAHYQTLENLNKTKDAAFKRLYDGTY